MDSRALEGLTGRALAMNTKWPQSVYHPSLFPKMIEYNLISISLYISVLLLEILLIMHVLVFWGCITKYHRLGGLKEKLFAHSVEPRSLRLRCQQDWFLLRPLSLVCRWPSSP